MFKNKLKWIYCLTELQQKSRYTTLLNRLEVKLKRKKERNNELNKERERNIDNVNKLSKKDIRELQYRLYQRTFFGDINA